MKETQIYDYIIVGAGAAGLMLANAMALDPFFSDKRILILDKDPKEANDRTWCFWEKNEGPLEALICRDWSLIGVSENDQLAPSPILPPIGTRVSPDVVVSEVAGQRGAGLCEPWVLDAGVIGNEVENDPDTSGVGIGHQPIKVVHVAVRRIDRAVVRYVVAEIRHRPREERCDPHQVNTKCLEMIEMGNGPTSESANDRMYRQ